MTYLPNVAQKMQRTATAESEGMKSPSQPSDKVLTLAQGTELMASTKQLSYKSARQNKSFSAAASGSVLCKKRLQGHSGLDHHPYQSSHPNYTRLDLNIASKDNLSSFTQRVMSAKLLRLKQLQNQLSEAHLHLNELCTENRLLRSLQKRQDLALDRYEGTQAQLPQLVRSHQEEVRVLRTKYKTLKHQFRSVTNTLKERETELQNLKEQHAHLFRLSKDRNLGEREALTKQVTDLNVTVENQASTIQVLNRKVLLETKNLKFQLQQEMQKHKTTQSELQQTFVKMEQLQMQLDQVKERSSLPLSMDRLGKSPSTVKLPGGHKSARGISIERNPPPNSRFKKTNKESGMHISSNNTDPSSVLLDSSPATYSEKTNEFSTSLDSSPEHTVNDLEENNSIVPVNMKSNSYQFYRDVKRKELSDFNIDANRVKKMAESSSSFGTVCNEVLEREYEDAVAMLSELSTKHSVNFEEDISNSLASLDLKSAKHVATLANATFALKGECRQSKRSPTKIKLAQDSSPVKMNLIEENATLSANLKSKQQSVSDDSSLTKETDPSKLSNSHKENILRKKSTLESFLDHNDSSGGFMIETELFKHGPKNPKNQEPNAEELSRSKSTDEEMEASHKEALLKALKAIDDNSNRENDSDDSDSTMIKLTPGTGIASTQRVFSSVNSSGIGDTLGLSRRRKSFK